MADGLPAVVNGTGVRKPRVLPSLRPDKPYGTVG